VKLSTQLDPTHATYRKKSLDVAFRSPGRPMQLQFYQLKYPFPIPDQNPVAPVGRVFLVGRNADGSATIFRGKTSDNTYTKISGKK
jgi:hypothetical protein